MAFSIVIIINFIIKTKASITTDTKIITSTIKFVILCYVFTRTLSLV